MNSEGLSSVAVTDNQLNLLGNISVVDVKLLTTSSSLPLLKDTCTHFITTILSTRGLVDGQDPFPVFAVQPWSTLAHSIAKLAATKSHRCVCLVGRLDGFGYQCLRYSSLINMRFVVIECG